jgi:predicted RNA-binding protein YlxR (DUF448 family)
LPRATETERTCIVSRQSLPADRLIRFVLGPDRAVVADLRHRLPGRGAWVSADAEHVRLAEKRRLFAHAFDGEVAVAPGLAERVEAQLADAALASLSLARKAGVLIDGFAKVEAALAREAVIALVHAGDAGEDGVAKLAAVARRRFGEAGLPAIRCFSGEQLDLALGRQNVVHAALLAGPAGENVLTRVGELVRYRGGKGRQAVVGEPSFDASTGMN